MTVAGAGLMHKGVLHYWRVGVPEIFEEDGLRHGLHWDQTVGVQEVKDLGAAALKEQWLL